MHRFNNFSQIPHTYTTELPVGPGTVNNLGVKTLKQIVNINTAFRDDYNTSSATDFSIRLPQPLRKVISMQIYDHHIPPDNYSISKYYNKNNFIISRVIGGVQTNYNIVISDGMYCFTNVGHLESNINSAIATHNDLSDIQIEFDSVTLKSRIYTDNSANPFQLDFSFDTSLEGKDCRSTAKIANVSYRDHLTLGWILGFRGEYIKPVPSIKSDKKQYPSTLMSSHYSRCMTTNTKQSDNLRFSYMDPSGYSYISEGLLDLTGEQYLLLSVDDYQNNHNTVYMSPFKNQSLFDPNILGKLSDYRQYSVFAPSRVYFGPTDIDKLHLTIYDPYGRIYNNNYGDYSIELLVETVYDGS